MPVSYTHLDVYKRKELNFFYDAQNRPAVVVYNGVPYAYVKSLPGDIVALLLALICKNLLT